MPHAVFQLPREFSLCVLTEQEHLNTKPVTWLFGSHFSSFSLDGGADEEIYIQNNR